MDGSQSSAVYAAVIGLVVFGILLVIACVVCKICLTSRKAQRWSGLDKVLRHPDRKVSGDLQYESTIRGNLQTWEDNLQRYEEADAAVELIVLFNIIRAGYMV